MEKQYFLHSKTIRWILPIVFFCLPLTVMGQTTIACQTFESDINTWDNDDGSRDTNSKITSTGSLKLDDDENAESDDYDFSPYDYVTLTFTFKTENFDSGRDVVVEFRNNGGWEEIAKYDEGDEFFNGVNKTVTLTVRASDYDFTDGTNDKFRIRNRENSNDEDLYIDDVCITGYVYSVTDTTIACQTFESDINTWDNDDGSRDTNSKITSTGSLKLDDDENAESDDYDFSPYDYVTLTFTFKTENFDSGRDVVVEFRNNGGWEEIAKYDEGDEFFNGVNKTVTLTVRASDYDFTDGTNDKFRIRNRENSNDEDLYIDDVCITGYVYSVTDTTIACQTFESDINTWDNDDGSRDTNSKITSTGSLKLDDDENAESDDYDFSPYDYVTLTFTFKTENFDSGRDVVVEFRNNGGWEEIAKYDEGDEFFNGVNKTVTLTVRASDYDFTDGTNDKFRIRNRENSNDEDLYIDDVCITGYNYSTGPTPNATVIGNSVTIVDGDSTPTTTDHTDFGSLDIGTGTVVRTFSIRNDGTADLTIGAITLGGTGSGDFSASALSPVSPIAAGNTSTFTVTYTPSTVGTSDATISIVTDSPGENPYNFSITAEATDPNVVSIACQDFQTDDTGWDESGSDGGRDATNISGSSHSYMMDSGEEAESIQYDFSAYGSVKLDLTFETTTWETSDGDNILIQFNDGSGWTTLSDLSRDAGSFTNGVDQAHSVTVKSSDYNFRDGTNDRFRVVNSADSTNDDLFIDDVCITGYAYCYEDIVCTGSTKTWNGSAWSPSAPTANDPVILTGAYNTSPNGNFSCCTLTVSTGSLIISSGDLVEVQSNIVNTGGITISDNGSLVQYYDSATNSGTGSLTVVRQSEDMLQYDYTYWGAPVSGFDMSNINHTAAYSYTNGAWSVASGNMIPGVGYILRTDNTSNTVPTKTTATFVGTLNNGSITYATDSSNSGYDLLSNPYPSAMDAADFIINSTNQGLFNGTLYFWTHNTRISDYANGSGQFTANDYASYNLTGGTAASSGGTVPNGNIGTGQAFFVQSIGTGNITFNNCMRSVTAGDNSQFFKSGEKKKSHYNRFWLDLINETGSSKQMLIGFDNNATLGFDRLYDGKVRNGENLVSIYSFTDGGLEEETKLSIQGRSIPLNEEETIKIGVDIMEGASENNTISLANFEGLFEEQEIYLVDKQEGIVHDLKNGAYSFRSKVGTIDDRFEIKFKNNFKIYEEPKEEIEPNVDNQLAIASRGNEIGISSNQKNIISITVYDLLGKTLFNANNITAEEFNIKRIRAKRAMLIISVTYEDGTTDVKKIIH